MSDYVHPAVTHLWQISESMQQSDNQHRLFKPSCWVNQRRSHSVPWVLTRTCSCFLTSGHLHFYLCNSLVMHIHATESIIFSFTSVVNILLRTDSTDPIIQLPSISWSCDLSQSTASGYVLFLRQNRLLLIHYSVCTSTITAVLALPGSIFGLKVIVCFWEMRHTTHVKHKSLFWFEDCF